MKKPGLREVMHSLQMADRRLDVGSSNFWSSIFYVIQQLTFLLEDSAAGKGRAQKQKEKIILRLRRGYQELHVLTKPGPPCPLHTKLGEANVSTVESEKEGRFKRYFKWNRNNLEAGWEKTFWCGAPGQTWPERNILERIRDSVGGTQWDWMLKEK